jgi:hypothetical protein
MNNSLEENALALIVAEIFFCFYEEALRLRWDNKKQKKLGADSRFPASDR